ncbi:phosphoribosyltransferase [Patescibacteria group bacterium]|nr:phosphoribosyltransferase [Patescibacteria group bacterium]MBU1673122.1 phosphoribosyltransferase [Patescibacteria group bacterium]MBU1963800.1 phosphoribosyltransferase [Patescibacteria group bacterium]
MFKDRADAGKQLVKKLEKYKDNPEVIVIAIPRGGVATGFEVAKALHLPLDVVVTKKIGAPSNPEYAIGSVNRHGDVFFNEEVASTMGIDQAWLDAESNKLQIAIQAKLNMLKAGEPPVDLKNKIVILVDDGIATGYTALAAAKFIKDEGAKKVIMAMPVVPADNIHKFDDAVDEFIYLNAPQLFMAVGQFYDDFQQVEDAEAKELLEEANK